ncbi:TetR/AcrR family transcriptional regulator [Nibrella saemangeumensis]|uniref:TetR/AcrR family transcriptional regulator n=1 Tax=Nibrella saemangeumensis TaxID=1084526 RepID=A0ABP8MRY8_9BACT
MQRDRALTEQKLIDAVGQIIHTDGIDEVGINRIANRAGVNKILIYRYFGGLDGLMDAYVRQAKPVISTPMLDVNALKSASLEEVYKTACEYIIGEFRQLRKNTEAREFLRKNLFEPDAIHNPLGVEREKQANEMIEGLSKLIGTPHAQGFAAIVASAMMMLTFLSQPKRVMMGLDLSTDEAWSKIEDALRQMFRGAYLTTRERLANANGDLRNEVSTASGQEVS